MRYYPHAKIVLEAFDFAETDSLIYPATVVNDLGITQVDFAPITVFYGGNGCGKSTLLNIIGRKLQLPGCNSGNDAEGMSAYLEGCQHHLEGITNLGGFEGYFIRSEVIMNSIVAKRKKYFEIKEKIRECSEKWESGMYEQIYETDGSSPTRFSGFESNWLNKIGYFNQCEMQSNGQCAMQLFDDAFIPGNVYLLDEPENSLSPKYQKELARLIEQYAYLFGCQFIIATHSPFLLAMNDVKIYDLDSRPVREREWTELENIRILHDLFKRFEKKFDKAAPPDDPSDSQMTALIAGAKEYVTPEEAISIFKDDIAKMKKRNDREFEFPSNRNAIR